MNGKIVFHSLADLAEFLKCWTGSTAAFEVKFDRGYWVLTFTGGF